MWTSPQLTLRYLAGTDLPDVVAMLRKESVCEHLFFGPNTEKETLDYFGPFVDAIEKAQAEQKVPEAPVFTLLHPSTGRFMGTCALLPVELNAGCYLIGFQLDEPFWRQGFGTRAARFLVQFAFGVLQARRITGDCFAGNTGSARIMEGVGFRAEGTQRNHYVKLGRPVDNLLFGLLRDEVDPALLEEWPGELRHSGKPGR